MRNFLLFIFLMSFSFSQAQINRYDTPAESDFFNTYVSPDYGALIEMGAAMKIKKIRENIEIIQNLYRSCSYYPSSIPEGWHKVFMIEQDDDFLLALEAYVDHRNQLVKFKFRDEIIEVSGDPVENGCINKNGQHVYFMDYVLAYDKEKKQRGSENTQIQSSSVKGKYFSIGSKVKINSDYLFLDILVLRTGPNLDFPIVYKFTENDKGKLMQVLDNNHGFVKVKYEDKVGYISSALLVK